MASGQTKPSNGSGLSRSVDFHYIKSPGFRSVHADGVWGGATPRGYITMSFYSERFPIPQKLVFEHTPEGRLGKEISRQSRDGLIREVDVEVMMDLEMAKSFRVWLDDKIQFLEKEMEKRKARR